MAPFDPDNLLPDALQTWIMDEADRMPCAPDYVAAAAVVALGAIIGARCAIKPKSKDDWLGRPNLWGGAVGLPSAKKSPAIGAALTPMDKLIAQSTEKHKAAMEDLPPARRYSRRARKPSKAALRPERRPKTTTRKILNPSSKNWTSINAAHHLRPILRRYKTNDSTIEKLGELLQENPVGLLMLRDELVGLLASWEREGREGERAFFLEGWNGNASFDTDRIGRGSIFIPNLCLSSSAASSRTS